MDAMPYTNTYWNPTDTYSLLNKAFNSFEPFLTRTEAKSGDLNYDEKAQAYSTEINAAGYKRSEITIEVQEDFIKIIANNEKYGRSTRHLYLEGVDSESIDAILEDGILKLSAKKLAAKRPHKIQIR